MSKNEIDPEVKKAIWKVILYAVTVFASLFAGNVAAKNGYKFVTPNTYFEYVQQISQSN